MNDAAYATEIPETPGYYVYRLWADATCLYVGRIGDNGPRPPKARLNQHRHTKQWWPEVTRIEVALLPDHPSIVLEERTQIAALKPLHNRQYGNCSHDLSLPNAVDTSNGRCRICDRARNRVGNMTPAQVARARQRNRLRQPANNAIKRRTRRAPGSDQGGLW